MRRLLFYNLISNKLGSCNNYQITYPAATLKSFGTGLVSATVTIVTSRCTRQLVDIVGAAVLYLSEGRFFTAASRPIKADLSCDFTLSHYRMTTIQPAWDVSTTSVHRWTRDCHLCTCSSLESIPAIEGVVTLSGYRYVGFFSFLHRTDFCSFDKHQLK